MVMGINEQTFYWELQPGALFDAPELIMVYASKGIGEMSRKLHRAYRAHLIPPHWRHTRRPLLINSWEAAYFDFDENKLYDFACRAHALGIEMLVMDDGWFGNRIDAKRALGDWTVNENKLHGGLKPLVDRIHALGMQFGIWFEPEMISPDSDLYRAHPDWCLHLPHREQSQARFQYVLDITRKDVRDHIWAQMDQILSSCRIDYVKWDFNRPFTEAGSTMLDAAHQGELNHRFTLGTYDLQHRLLTSYPDILLENCSGGGGRFDPAMLYFSPQIWCSDNTDPIERLSIQFGTSLCYPSESMGAHVSASPRANLKTKGNVALWGTHGYEMDPGRFTPQDESVVQEQVAAYHKYYDLVHTGDLYRLVSPNENAYYCAWELVAQDKHEALVTVVNMRQQPYHGRLLRLREGVEHLVAEIGRGLVNARVAVFEQVEVYSLRRNYIAVRVEQYYRHKVVASISRRLQTAKRRHFLVVKFARKNGLLVLVYAVGKNLFCVNTQLDGLRYYRRHVSRAVCI